MEQIRFSSTDHAGSEAFGAYRDLCSADSQTTQIGAVFSAEVSGVRFPRMWIFDRAVEGVSHERDAHRVDMDGLDYLTLQLVLTGRMTSVADDRLCEVETGEIVIFDLSRPYKTSSRQLRVATVTIAREVVTGAIPALGHLHGLVLPVAGSEILGDFIRSLLRNRCTLDSLMAATVTASLAALLAVTRGASTGAAGAMHLLDAAKLNQILDYVEANLGRADLAAASIATRMGVSRSALYRLFEQLGGVSARIQQRRLQAVRRALARPDDLRSFKTIAQANGFVSAGHANRSFREAFGTTPGEFRQARREQASGSGTIETLGKAQFARWCTEMR